jgi:hypothetical protein
MEREKEENDPYEDDDASHSEESENDFTIPNVELLKEILSPEASEILSQIQHPGVATVKQQQELYQDADSVTIASNILDTEFVPSSNNKSIQSTTIELPVRNSLYSTKEYWDDRFRTEDVRNWLVTYEEVKDQLVPYLSSQSRILMIGCGNSTFSEELYDAGYQFITNLDYSEIVIDVMRSKYGHSRPHMTWMVRSFSIYIFLFLSLNHLVVLLPKAFTLF